MASPHPETTAPAADTSTPVVWNIRDPDERAKAIRTYIYDILMPKFAAAKARKKNKQTVDPENPAIDNCKQYSDGPLFAELEKHFQISQHYFVDKFTQSLYNTFNNKTGYTSRTKSTTTGDDKTPGGGASTSTSAAASATTKKQYRSQTGLDAFKSEIKSDSAEGSKIKAQRDSRISAGDGQKPIVIWNDEAKTMYEGLSPEAKEQWENTAKERNEARKKGPTPEEYAATVAQNQINIGTLVGDALRALPVGRASFAVAMAYQDDATRSQRRALGNNDLPGTLVLDEDGTYALPSVDATDLTIREIISMLESLFDVVHKNAEVLLPLGPVGERTTVPLRAATPAQLREYFSYALECQRRGERPEVTISGPPPVIVEEEQPPASGADEDAPVDDWSAPIVPQAPEDVLKKVEEELAAKKKKGKGKKRQVIEDSDEDGAENDGVDDPKGVEGGKAGGDEGGKAGGEGGKAGGDEGGKAGGDEGPNAGGDEGPHVGRIRRKKSNDLTMRAYVEAAAEVVEAEQEAEVPVEDVEVPVVDVEDHLRRRTVAGAEKRKEPASRDVDEHVSKKVKVAEVAPRRNPRRQPEAPEMEAMVRNPVNGYWEPAAGYTQDQIKKLGLEIKYQATARAELDKLPKPAM
ncbi:hypothetical protein R3P38DRAFT_3235270 [Favolaschia claudopus]|uniref:Uncharacterized protein n=1 Tax=Favolaschia claudopus TaxID=2862362 RepID=A0AAV9ZER6_9AGAR